jgi:hypothetical protein
MRVVYIYIYIKRRDENVGVRVIYTKVYISLK